MIVDIVLDLVRNWVILGDFGGMRPARMKVRGTLMAFFLGMGIYNDIQFNQFHAMEYSSQNEILYGTSIWYTISHHIHHFLSK